MLPPILEVYVVWHPHDTRATEFASQIFDHFHGTAFSGLIGGAVEVYERSAGWRSVEDSPRPIAFPGSADPSGVQSADIVVVVPIVGAAMASAIEERDPAWTRFIGSVVAAQSAAPNRVAIFPHALAEGVLHQTILGGLIGRFQQIASPSAGSATEPTGELLCRDLSQGIAQLIRPSNQRLTVFVSHTKRSGPGEMDTPKLLTLVRQIITETRLQHFFDASDLQPGTDWDDELRKKASNSAMLVLRTDLYATREWCQREMVIAKRHGMPVVTLDCMSIGEERGSFLMDHIPRIPVRRGTPDGIKDDVRHGLNVLVNECLKRELWAVQKRLAPTCGGLDASWWAPHAPEPLTLLHWLEEQRLGGKSGDFGGTVRVLHPDPPLGPEEVATLQQLLGLVVQGCRLEVMTPRTLASRGA